MKKWLLFVVLPLLLTGCTAGEPLETVADTWEEPALPAAGIHVDLPAEAAVPTLEQEGKRVYVCQDYEVYVETLTGGDLNRTIETLTGYAQEDLTVVETRRNDLKRYDLVWVCTGEEGERLGRAAILDDGKYHYTLTLLRNADSTESTQIVWRTVFESFCLEEV